MARQPNRGTIRKQPTSTAVDEPNESLEPKIEFFDLIGQFSDEEWRSMKAYIYRVWPVIDRKEKEHFLSKIQHSFDEDFLLSTFGTGKYYMRVNNSKGITIASHTVSVYNTQHPPRVNPEEVVVSDPENERYFKAWGKPQPLPDSNGGVVADIARAALLEGNRRPSLDPQILGLWEKTNAERDNLAQRLVEMSQKQPPASAVEPITMLREMLGVMREIQPPVPPAAPIDQIADAVATRLGVVGRGAISGDPFSQWEKVQAFLERAGGVAAAVNPEGAGVGVAGDVSSSWAPHIANIISEARGFVPELMQAWFAVRSSAAPPAVPNNDGVLEMLPLDKRIETIFKAGFESMRRGVTGQQFAQWLCLSGEMPGGLEAFNILKPAGAAGLVAMAATNPLGAQIVNDAAVRPQLDVFLADFFSFNSAAGSAVASAA